MTDHEAHISAQQAQAAEQARLPEADEHQERPRGSVAPPRQGPQGSEPLSGSPTSAPLTLPKQARLRASADYRRVFDAGHKVVRRLLVLHWTTTGDIAQPARMGVVASKKVGNSPERHRAKRLVREAWRHVRHTVPSGSDLVVLCRGGMLKARMQDVREDLEAALKQAGIVTRES